MKYMEYHKRIPDPPHEAAFIQEVNKDLRAEQLQQLWRKYSSLILTITVCLLILIAGSEVWKQWQARKIVAYALRYDESRLLMDSGHTAEGAAMLAALAAEADGGYKVLATLRLAAVFAKREEKGEFAKALAMWRRVAANPVVPRPYREAAAFLTALNGIGIVSDAEIYYLLSPLIAEKSPWRFLALEITAILAIKREDSITAHVILTRLADDLQAPAGIRSRANILRQTLPLFSMGRDKDT